MTTLRRRRAFINLFTLSRDVNELVPEGEIYTKDNTAQNKNSRFRSALAIKANRSSECVS